ncbi:hypothetical protein O3G_MSEX002251 [Manduca sexta]|uniref:Uncharacterized protein n=1 Tax=Manduca sexta TaxID=7130 RepID=A0A922CCU9_MANSE|nr:hypothetical protein O3G_MSEX002251 [Manduca sexta]
MRWTKNILLLLPILISTCSAEWSWSADSKDTAQEQTKDTPDLLQDEHLPEPQGSLAPNNTVLDDIVDELVSRKQGRSLGGFDGVDDVYSDPTIKDALDAGDDAEARNLIKGRLCTLGLIQCEDDETQEKRYVSPDELIYAQPVDIKPIGKPVASIPIRGPPRAYGPPKPMVYPPRPQKIPPKRVGYGGPPRPGFSDKYSSSANHFQFSQSSGVYGGETNYVTKPPSYTVDSPYSFDHNKPSFNKVPPTIHTSSKTENVVQQHVHHHYVHSDAEKDPKVIVKPVVIPVGSVGHLGSQSQQFQQSSDIITGGGADFSSVGGFKPMSGGYVDNKPVYEGETIYGSQYGYNNVNKGSSNILTQGLPNQFQNNAFEDQKYGNSLGSYASHSTDFYKKELHVGSANNLYNQGPATFGQSQSNAYQGNYHEGKAQGFECVCVNYDQCPAQEIIDRKDELHLAIDPRNKGTEIVALTEEQLNNITKSDLDTAQNSTDSTSKSVQKREVKNEKPEEAAKEIEPRVFGLPGYGGNGNNPNKKVEPTFGVSFGLPQPSHGILLILLVRTQLTTLTDPHLTAVVLI